MVEGLGALTKMRVREIAEKVKQRQGQVVLSARKILIEVLNDANNYARYIDAGVIEGELAENHKEERVILNLLSLKPHADSKYLYFVTHFVPVRRKSVQRNFDPYGLLDKFPFPSTDFRDNSLISDKRICFGSYELSMADFSRGMPPALYGNLVLAIGDEEARRFIEEQCFYGKGSSEEFLRVLKS